MTDTAVAITAYTERNAAAQAYLRDVLADQFGVHAAAEAIEVRGLWVGGLRDGQPSAGALRLDETTVLVLAARPLLSPGPPWEARLHRLCAHCHQPVASGPRYDAAGLGDALQEFHPATCPACTAVPTNQSNLRAELRAMRDRLDTLIQQVSD